MGSSAADIGTTGPDGKAPGQFQSLLETIARSYPYPDACPKGSQPDRPWVGSPCVFRYVEDAAEATEGGRAARGPNDSQSDVRSNADKLAREVADTARRAGRRVVLIGYSMGGAIIRTYLATHKDEAERRVQAVIFIDAVASGSWGYAFAGEVPRRVGGPMGQRIDELMRSLAASAAAVDFDRPATRDLSPRSLLFRSIAPMPLPRNISYYTFWGDIRIVVGRQLLAYDLPTFAMPSLGDLGLLPGDPDPTKLPELGGQRFSPKVDGDHESLDVGHKTRIELGADVIGDLISSCGRKPDEPSQDCRRLVARHFDIPNTHTAIPVTLDRVEVSEPRLGGRVTVLDAVIEAIRRSG